MNLKKITGVILPPKMEKVQWFGMDTCWNIKDCVLDFHTAMEDTWKHLKGAWKRHFTELL